MSPDQPRMAELLSALSITMDLAMAQAPEQSVRACLVATGLARRVGLAESEVADVYYTTLLRHIGCTATAHEESQLFGDELVLRPYAERHDSGSRRESLGLLLRAGQGTGVRRIGFLTRTVRAGPAAETGILRAICEVGALLADRLTLGAEVTAALGQMLERWDGTGLPHGAAGEQIPRPARYAHVATQAVIFDRLGGTGAAESTLRRRAGGWLDPELVAAFTPDLLRALEHVDVWDAVLEAEPAPYRRMPAGGLDRVAETFADFVDLKSPYLFGHSTGVAELAQAAGHRLGFGVEDCVALRHAGLFHDLGRVAVPTGVWDKPGPLGRGDWEKVRLHPYHTERILSHSETLAPLARLAGAHHERRDGSGYPSGRRELSAAECVLAVADAYQGMTQLRPHRPALSAEVAAETILSLVREGALDSDAAGAVLAAAGVAVPRRTARPDGLSEREAEVLRLVAYGRSNPEIAATLGISRRTAEHHVQHIYTKIGVSTRAAAAVYAMTHHLLAE